MTQVIQGATNPSPEDSGPKYKLIRSTDLDRTEKQIGLIVGVLEELRMAVHLKSGIGSDDGPEIDPRVREAAVKSYEDASLQLRNLLNEQPRWSQEDPESSGFIEKLGKSNRELVLLQKKHISERLRPFALLGGCLRRIEYQGQPGWLAAVGKEPDPAGLFGIGSSPADAVDAFDQAYRANAVAELAKETAAEPTQPEKKPKSPAARKKRAAGNDPKNA